MAGQLAMTSKQAGDILGRLLSSGYLSRPKNGTYRSTGLVPPRVALRESEHFEIGDAAGAPPRFGRGVEPVQEVDAAGQGLLRARRGPFRGLPLLLTSWTRAGGINSLPRDAGQFLEADELLPRLRRCSASEAKTAAAARGPSRRGRRLLRPARGRKSRLD